MESTLREYNSPRKLLRIATTMVGGGCAVNGTAVAAVLIDQSRFFNYLHIRYVYWIATRLPIAKFGGFCRQHLATLATPTIRSIKCKQSPVYGVFWPLLPHPSTDRNETRTWSSSLSPRNLSVKFGTYLSTIFSVIVVTDRHTDT